MATINFDYCEEADLYNSGEIEEELLKIYKSGRQATIRDNPDFFYTVTDIRENIINWYPFKKGSTILEVGGGLGAITGTLCKNAKKVVSNEYSRRRAENIYYRHKDKNNLEVVVGNIEKIEFKEKFDYIVLIGVFEYSKRFFKKKNPFHFFLNKLKSLLKENGVILIAIENRYGIKYFSGATEDHYGEKYLGLYGYKDYDIETFGKYQLDTIISDCGFSYSKYYYPYPDYKMPYIIYTENRLPLDTEIPGLLFYNHGEQVYDYDYRKVLSGIISNKQFGFFANSFLIEISNNQNALSSIDYVKTSYLRTKKYQINTILDNGTYYKIPKYDEGYQHIKNILETNNSLKKLDINVPKITLKEKYIEIENINGKNLTELIKESFSLNNRKEVSKLIDNYYNFIKRLSTKKIITSYLTEEEKKFFENQKIYILKMGLYDLHPSNILINKGNFFLIDQEWKTKYDIPLKYMFYFGISYIYESIPELELFLPKQEVMSKYNITQSEVVVYSNMSKHISDSGQQIDNEILPIISQHGIFNIEKEERKKIIDNCNQLNIENSNLMELNNQLNIENSNLMELNNQLKDNLEKNTVLIETLKQSNEEKENEILKIMNSRSWKYTKPIRQISKKVRKWCKHEKAER